jgi:signal transduction histidine kinase
MTELQAFQTTETDRSQDYHMTEQWERSVAELQQRACLTPRPLTSNTPVIGGFLAWFRNAWNSVSTRWYIAPLIQQQNEFNQGVVDELRAIRSNLQSLHSELQTLAIAQHELRQRFNEIEDFTRFTLQGQDTKLELKQLLDEISDRLIATDRDVVALTHDLGKVTYAVIRLDEDLKRLDGTLSG